MEAFIGRLMDPSGDEFLTLAMQSELGADLALAHLDLMREAGEQPPASLLALERKLKPSRF